MRERKLYLQNEDLQKRVREIAEEAARAFAGKVRYEEMIALPHFGQIMLRFDHVRSDLSLDRLDREEALLRKIAGEDFLVDFMGSVYAAAGVELSALDERLPGLAVRFRGEGHHDSCHGAFLREDGKQLLKKAGLDPALPLWEIQMEGEDFLLLTMGPESIAAAPVPGCEGLSVGCVSEAACTGLFGAATFAQRKRISLARALFQLCQDYTDPSGRIVSP